MDKSKLKLVKKICKNCGGVCCKLGGAEFTRKEMKKVINSGYPDYFRKINEDHYETITRNGICAYLNKKNICTIQEIKPKMCWAWPVNLDFRGKKKVYCLMNCKLTPYLSEKEIKKMKKQIAGYSQEFIDCDDTQMSETEVKKVMKRYHKFGKKVMK